ncbi:MAG: permease [Desulfonatronovibrionaceae bacterium]
MAAFLISTPETGVDSIAVTWALLGPVMTILRPLAAFITAGITGIMIHFLDKTGKSDQEAKPGIPLEPLVCQMQTGSDPALLQSRPSPGARIKAGMSYAFDGLFRDIAGWFLAGIVLAGVLSVFLTPDMVDQWMGNAAVSMLIMLVVAVPLYVCATASTPIAAALVAGGLNPGAALVFLLAGPVTNAASLAVVVRILGKKAAFLYLAGIIICSLGLGFLTNLVYAGLVPDPELIQPDQENYGLISLFSTVILLALSARAALTKFRRSITRL